MWAEVVGKYLSTAIAKRLITLYILISDDLKVLQYGGSVGFQDDSETPPAMSIVCALYPAEEGNSHRCSARNILYIRPDQPSDQMIQSLVFHIFDNVKRRKIVLPGHILCPFFGRNMQDWRPGKGASKDCEYLHIVWYKTANPPHFKDPTLFMLLDQKTFAYCAAEFLHQKGEMGQFGIAMKRFAIRLKSRVPGKPISRFRPSWFNSVCIYQMVVDPISERQQDVSWNSHRSFGSYNDSHLLPGQPPQIGYKKTLSPERL